MTESNIDSQINKIHDTVTGIRFDFGKFETKLEGEQKATNKAVADLCQTVDRYSTGTEKRLSAIEVNLGSKIPDDPTAFSQIQTLQGFRKQTLSRMKALWGFILTLITSLILLFVSQFLNLFGKGHQP